MNGLQELRRLACDQIHAKYPNLPEAAVTPPPYADRTANSLTKAICDYLRLCGGYAVRINTTGQIRGGKWVKGTTRRGTADIHAVYQGTHLSIEVKFGLDRQSDYQKRTQAEVTQAGGIYYLAKDFQSFFDWIQTIKEQSQLRTGPKYQTVIQHTDNDQR